MSNDVSRPRCPSIAVSVSVLFCNTIVSHLTHTYYSTVSKLMLHIETYSMIYEIQIYEANSKLMLVPYRNYSSG